MLRDLQLPLWITHLLFSPVLGFLLAAAGVLLAATAWRSAGNRRVLAGAGAFVLIAAGLNTAILLTRGETAGERLERVRRTKAEHVALPAAQRIGGLLVPAGSVVNWKGDDHKDAEVWFAGPVQGMKLVGEWDLGEFFWSGRLAEEHTLDGWPCGAGEIYIDVDGHLQMCTLDTARKLADVTVPAGSHVDVSMNNQYEPAVRETKITLAAATVADGGVRMSPGAYLTLFGADAIELVEAQGDQVVAFGIPLAATARWSYKGLAAGIAPPAGTQADYIGGQLAAELRCGSRRVAADTFVGVAPAAGGGAQVKLESDAATAPAIGGCVVAR